MRVNLHTHSTVSDGNLTPEELANMMNEEKVELWSLTDHDKIDGLFEASIVSEKLGLSFITGIEFSVKTNNLDIDFLDPLKHTLHVLVLGFDFNKAVRYFELLRQEKQARLNTLINTLNNEGYSIINYNDGSKTNIAKQLVKHGFAIDIENAFNKIINNYYDRYDDFFLLIS